jgi:hypothetical protein
MLQDRAIDGTEEPLRVDLGFVRFSTVAMTAVGDDDLAWIGELSAQCIGDRSRDSRDEIDPVERMTGAFEESNVVQAQTEDLVAINRLQKASQRLGVKALAGDDQLADGLRKSHGAEDARAAQYGQSIQRVVPEILILGERLEGLQQRSSIDRRVPLEERCPQLLDEVAKADRVLLVVRMPSVSRLVDREAWRRTVSQELGEQFIREQRHPLFSLCHMILIFLVTWMMREPSMLVSSALGFGPCIHGHSFTPLGSLTAAFPVHRASVVVV